MSVLNTVLQLELDIIGAYDEPHRVAEVEALITDSFQEIDATGTLYNREQTLDAFASGDLVGIAAELHDPVLVHSTEDSAVMTYVMRSQRGVARNTSLWTRDQHGWRLAFHQISRG